MLEGLNGRQQQRNEGTHSQILISPAGDWTRALSNSVDEWSHKGTWVAPCWVQGPFLSPFNAAVGFGHLVVVTSGIGMSAAMPLVLQVRAPSTLNEASKPQPSRALAIHKAKYTALSVACLALHLALHLLTFPCAPIEPSVVYLGS